MHRSSKGSRSRGQILVLFVLALVAIIAGVGLVIDGGFTFAQRRAEQNAADLAAFAGANALLNGQNATAAAQATAADNGYPNGSGVTVNVAVTSTTGWIRRLGGRRWNLLHRLVYVSAIGGALHYWWKVKLDVTNPMIYAAIVGVLLGWRIVKALSKRESRSRAARASALSEG